MSDLTKQEIDLLMMGVDKLRSIDHWQSIGDAVITCHCSSCNLARQERETREACYGPLRAKLLSMRDSIVADEFFASIPAGPVDGQLG